ncbi:MAG TPA: CBS domain-containing protein [Nitrosopumilaceae archaeon]|nr:CBS domain-containing protein [Nitrosopumilaceae archaeon]
MSTEFSKIKVKDVMSKELITVDPGTTVFQIAKMMEKGGIGAVLMKKDGTTSGIVTDRDFAIKIATQKLSLETPVDDVASSPLETISSDESILVAANKMSSKKIRKLAVVENNNIVGIITSTDLVNQLAKK